MSWLNDVVGGISTPRIYKLEDNNRIINGSAETVLSTEWFGTDTEYSRVAAADQNPAFIAPKGDYVLKVEDNNAAAWECAMQSPNYGAALGDTSWLITGKIRASSTNHDVDIKFGSAAAADGAITAGYTQLTIPAKTDYNRIFHLVHTFSSETDEFIRLELGATTVAVGGTGIVFYDDIRVYQILETYNLEQPNVVSGNAWEQDWRDEIIADFDLIDGKNRKVSNGWRYYLNMIYNWHSPSDQQDIIKITESGLNFVIPHIDNLFGSYMRWNGDFKNEYFFGRYLAHSTVVSLKAIELERDKPREIGTDFTVA